MRPRARECAISLLAAWALAVLVACGSGPQLVRRPKAPDEVLIQHVDVLDVVAGRVERDRDVALRGDRIAAIGLAGALTAGRRATVIDGNGATLVPGLVDAHGHIAIPTGPVWEFGLATPELNLRAYLYAGVTTVFDPGDGSEDGYARAAQVDSGDLLGPRIFLAGPIHTAPGSHPVALLERTLPWFVSWYLLPKIAVTLSTPEQARAAIAPLGLAGRAFTKVIFDRIPLDAERMDRAVLDALVDEAHRGGVRVVAHVGTLEDTLETGQAGVDAWVHAPYKQEVSADDAARIAAFGIPMVPTLAIFEAYANLRHPPRMSTPLERETVPAEQLAAFDALPPVDDGLVGEFGPFLDLLEAQRGLAGPSVLRLHQAGVTILAGSDTQAGMFPGAGLHRELALLRAAGLPAIELLRSATLYPARFLEDSADPDFGVIAVGKRADLILVEGDPLADPAVLESLRAVILRGVPLERIPVATSE